MYELLFRPDGRESCSIEWKSANIFTDGDILTEQTAFTFYSFIVGFLGPLGFILTFYVLVLVRLQSVGPQGKGRSENTRRANRKVRSGAILQLQAHPGLYHQFTPVFPWALLFCP